jgi:hypothetical protein
MRINLLREYKRIGDKLNYVKSDRNSKQSHRNF